MILPIVAYGDPVLKRRALNITPDYADLQVLISNMYETMRNANGVGLAAPQVGKSIRLFIVDSRAMYEEENKGINQVFINAELIQENGSAWPYEEGCLSIPGIREDVFRKARIKLRYVDENFIVQEATFDDLNARVIQHEYDHIEGKLFIDHLKPLKKTLLKSKLNNISKGVVDVKYKMKFAQR